MAEKKVKLSTSDRIKEVQSKLEEVASRRDELSGELNQLNQLFLKLQGAIEILNVIEDDKKEDKKSD